MAYSSFYKFEEKEGFQQIIDYKKAGLEILNFSVLWLNKGASYNFEIPGQESVLVLQSGDFTGEVYANGEKILDGISGTRTCVFDDMPTAVYIPAGASMKINTVNGMHARIFHCDANGGNAPFFCPPSKVIETEPGAKQWKRKYRSIFAPKGKNNGDITQRLIVGESVSVPGGWIGFPAHRHDIVTEKEFPLDEIFSMRVRGLSGGAAIQLSYDYDENGNRWDEMYAVEDDNGAIALPKGFHTSFALPGCEAYLFWGLAGSEKEYRVQFDERYLDLENALY